MMMPSTPCCVTIIVLVLAFAGTGGSSLRIEESSSTSIDQITHSVRAKREVSKKDDVTVKKDGTKKNKDSLKKIKTALLQAYVTMYRHKNVTGEEEKEDDFFCVSDGEDLSDREGIDEIDIADQVLKYLTKFIVKRSYTPFSYVKSTFETLGFITPIDNVIHKKEFSVIDIDPLTALFSNIQEIYNSYEEVEREEEITKLTNVLSRTGLDIDVKKPGGIINKLWPYTKPADDDDKNKKKGKCVLKKPEDLWDEIMPYDAYIIARSLIAAGLWLFAFWVPIFPFIFSFPSRNGGGIFITDDNRRDQLADNFDYYDSSDSQYSAYSDLSNKQYSSYEGNYIGGHSGGNQAQPYHVNYTSHDSHASQPGHQAHDGASLDAIVHHHIDNSQKVPGTQNVYVSNGKTSGAQQASSYTHYDTNDLWYNHGIL